MHNISNRKITSGEIRRSAWNDSLAAGLPRTRVHGGSAGSGTSRQYRSALGQGIRGAKK